MLGPNRRVARRTARRTTRRVQGRQASFEPEPAYEEPPPAAQPAAPAAEPGYVGELEQLAELKAKGFITDEEYEAKKKQILGI